MNRNGLALIEVLAALVILGSAGVSVVTYVSALGAFQERTIAREAEMARADRLLSQLSLLTAQELSQRIGVRTVDSFAVWIDRPGPDLFRIGLAPARQPEAEVLAALIVRPTTPSGRR